MRIRLWLVVLAVYVVALLLVLASVPVWKADL
jgi:hypothetical protein